MALPFYKRGTVSAALSTNFRGLRRGGIFWSDRKRQIADRTSSVHRVWKIVTCLKYNLATWSIQENHVFKMATLLRGQPRSFRTTCSYLWQTKSEFLTSTLGHECALAALGLSWIWRQSWKRKDWSHIKWKPSSIIWLVIYLTPVLGFPLVGVELMADVAVFLQKGHGAKPTPVEPWTTESWNVH